MADVFDEVERDLREERQRALFRKIAPYAAGAMAVIVALVAGREIVSAQRDSRDVRASEAYAALIQAVNEADAAEIEAAGDDVATSGASGYAALARMQQAGAALDAGDAEGAARLFDEAAALAEDPFVGDLAALKAAYAAADGSSLDALEARLESVAAPGAPFEALARELLAAAAVKAGAYDLARERYRALTLTPNAPQGVRGRAEEALAVIASIDEAAKPSPSEGEEGTEESDEPFWLDGGR